MFITHHQKYPTHSNNNNNKARCELPNEDTNGEYHRCRIVAPLGKKAQRRVVCTQHRATYC